jgi:hypothetical protein
MLRALTALLQQLSLPLAPPSPTPPAIVAPPDATRAPRTADELLARLRRAGLRDIDRLRLTTNRSVMVSCRARELRVHRAFLDAPTDVLHALTTFVEGRTRVERDRARRIVLGYAVPRTDVGGTRRRRDAAVPEDAPAEQRLAARHAALNVERFGGVLRPVTVRLSRRLRSRLGYYRLAVPGGDPPEIVISRRHLRRHGWAEAEATLLHEMVHQWQDESGLAVDHGRGFRTKARAVGVAPAARRAVG